MSGIKKLISKVLGLFVDIFLLGYKTGRQIIFPGKRKKGNLLSSLFIFFVDLIERVGSFEHGLFRMTNLLRQKYIKQSLLIVAGLLFLLSSIEWSGEIIPNTSSRNYISQLSNAGVKKITVNDSRLATDKPVTVYLHSKYPPYKNTLQSSTPASFAVKTYLLICSIRI